MTKTIQTLIALYIKQFKDPYTYETDGPLGISIDRRSDFIYEHVAPTLDNWKAVKPIWDRSEWLSNEWISNEERQTLDTFVEATYERMHELESVAKNIIVGMLIKGNVPNVG